MTMKIDLWLLAAIFFGAAEAAVSSNYTEARLSSGTSTGPSNYPQYLLMMCSSQAR